MFSFPAFYKHHNFHRSPVSQLFCSNLFFCNSVRAFLGRLFVLKNLVCLFGVGKKPFQNILVAICPSHLTSFFLAINDLQRPTKHQLPVVRVQTCSATLSLCYQCSYKNLSLWDKTLLDSCKIEI